MTMDYVAPTTLDEAYRALDADDSHCLAGGQSLVAMMNLGLVDAGAARQPAPHHRASRRRADPTAACASAR